MLQELYIRNVALIEEIRLHFGQGLNVLTGETGTGKSILIDALGLILGGRASSDLIRQGCDKALVEALFVVENAQPFRQLLQELGIEWEDQSLVIVREIASSGKTVCRVNGRIVTVQTLRQIGALLVDLAGQHEQQTLLRAEEHLAILDAFGGQPIQRLKQNTAVAYAKYRSAKKELEQAAVGEQERVQRLDMLRFQLEEIQSLRLQPEDEEQLEQERNRLSHAEKLSTIVSHTYDALFTGENRQQPILDSLHKLSHDLEQTIRYDKTLQSSLELIKSAAYQLEEAAHELRTYRDSVEFNPVKLQALEERLAALQRLRRKYAPTVNEILHYADQVEQELNRLENHEENIERLQKNLVKYEQELVAEVTKLSERRKSIADKLCKQIVNELSSLMMPRTAFSIGFSTMADSDGINIDGQLVHVNESGIDRIEFLFSSNPGEPLRPLSKIASGGELSRTLLAVKTILAGDGVETLIFDEIDTGISGRAAQAVAEKMAVVAAVNQVICVTHLPQVACMADCHFMIHKIQQSGRSQTMVKQLTDTERVEELARMLSGAELTETSRKHAEEMMEQARSLKNKAS
ncbi:DNA repair protein RecN [Effusibacillus dendaii]|uniref:DNA repair protein RecN n=1 Tax=Effusibacillus dendaii TaxID=2743772 RepID=A0A7I8D738_9BACL|nr:DNA repair protein RecN [Effusibacillus dendaii]BCJ85904.1 DNA repair protein RecN [Effusibacillus dendaii]